MKLYADTPGRRGWQLVTDLFVVAWLWFWIWLATKLYGLVLKLGVPGQKLAGAGDGMADGLADAGSKVHRVPVAGDSLAGPFTKAADAARSLADAGREEQQVVHQLAWVLALRALATQPLRRLSAVDDDPVAAWRQGDPETVAALADLELRRLGLRRHKRRRTSSTVDGPGS